MVWRVGEADRLRWIALCAVGEVMGLALGAMWYRSIEQVFGAPEDFVQRIPVLFFLALAGLLEGAVLGSLQAYGLRRLYPRLPVGLWINMTVIIAVTGWGLGAIYDAAAGPLLAHSAPNLIQEGLIAAAFGAAVGLAYGWGQALAFGRAAHNAKAWIGASVIAWTFALPVIVLAARTLPDGVAPIQAGLSALAAGLVAGLIVGVVTSFAFQGMPPRDAERSAA